MFKLESDEIRLFYEEKRATLDEEQLKLLDTYEKSLLHARHVELQILQWENQRFLENMSEHQDVKDIIQEECNDAKVKIEEKEKLVYELLHQQKTLNEQLFELIQLKQPVQHETTYIIPNAKQPHRKNNINVTPTAATPKLTYEAFSKQLYSVDSIRVEHLIKHETDRMTQGLVILEKSIYEILNNMDTEVLTVETKRNIHHVETLIKAINGYDMLSFMTITEHLELKKKLQLLHQEKSYEIHQFGVEDSILENRLKSLQCQYELDLKIIKQRHDHELYINTKQLNKQKQKLQNKINILLNHNLYPPKTSSTTTLETGIDGDEVEGGGRGSIMTPPPYHLATRPPTQNSEEGQIIMNILNYSDPKPLSPTISTSAGRTIPLYKKHPPVSTMRKPRITTTITAKKSHTVTDTGSSSKKTPVHSNMQLRQYLHHKYKEDVQVDNKVEKLKRLNEMADDAQRIYYNLQRRNKLEIEGYIHEIHELKKQLIKLEKIYQQMMIQKTVTNTTM